MLSPPRGRFDHTVFVHKMRTGNTQVPGAVPKQPLRKGVGVGGRRDKRRGSAQLGVSINCRILMVFTPASE